MAKQKIKLSKIRANIGQIEGLKKNPRVIKDAKLALLVKSLQETPELLEHRGLLVYPYDGGKKYVTIGGNQRLAAAKEAGFTEIWCEVLDEATSIEKLNEYIIKDNASFGEWDFDMLNLDWDTKELVEFGIDWSFEGAEGDNPQSNSTTDTEEDEAPEIVAGEPFTKTGDIWHLGKHKVICGDSTDPQVYEILMDGEKAEMVLTDPPYGMFLDTDFSSIKGSLGSLGRKAGTKGGRYDKVIGDNEDFTPELITTPLRIFEYCKEIFLFGADYFAEILPNKNDGSWIVWDKRKESQADAIGSEFELIWSKQRHKRRVLRHDWFGFLSSQNGKDARNRVHPTQKPITLLADIIKQWGKDADLIVDPFGGSGSTLITCEQLGRRCNTIELDPKYVDVIVNRYIALTGDTEIRLTRDGETKVVTDFNL